jgi:hypothetical protein
MDDAEQMLVATFLALTVFVFLAIVGGIAGIIVESRRDPATSPGFNPAVRDAIYPVVGWGSLFLLYFALELTSGRDLTPQFKSQLATLVLLPSCYAVLATARLIWRSARRIDARMRHREPVIWRAIPFLAGLAFPSLFLSAVLAAGILLAQEGMTVSTLLLASVAALLAFIRKRTLAQ